MHREAALYSTDPETMGRVVSVLSMCMSPKSKSLNTAEQTINRIPGYTWMTLLKFIDVVLNSQSFRVEKQNSPFA